MDHIITLQAEMPEEWAWALAQLLKRLGYSECRALAESEQQAYQMMYAGQQLRRALADAGIAPR